MTAARRKGKWVGGMPVLGYDISEGGGHLVVNSKEAEQVWEMFRLYTQHRSLSAVIEELGRRGWTTKAFRSKRGKQHGGRPFQEATPLRLLANAIYVGQVEHKGRLYTGEQAAIIEPSVWESIQDELRARRPGASRTVDNKPNALLHGNGLEPRENRSCLVAGKVETNIFRGFFPGERIMGTSGLKWGVVRLEHIGGS